jgi:hypothetical protein
MAQPSKNQMMGSSHGIHLRFIREMDPSTLWIRIYSARKATSGSSADARRAGR